MERHNSAFDVRTGEAKFLNRRSTDLDPKRGGTAVGEDFSCTRAFSGTKYERRSRIVYLDDYVKA